MSNYCIYRHIRLDTNEVFYIGIGSVKRPYQKYKRNNYWNSIINKTNYEIQILKSDLSWEDACELEYILINFYGRKNNKTGILCNMTDGGIGSVGYKHTIETKLKIGEKSRLKQISNSTRIKMAEAKTYPIINMITKEIINDKLLICKELNISKGYLLQMVKNKRTNITPYKYLKDFNNDELKYNQQKIK